MLAGKPGHTGSTGAWSQCSEVDIGGATVLYRIEDVHSARH